MDLTVYTDGSYSKSVPDITTGGMVILHNDELLAAQRYISKAPRMVKMNNAGGELMAAIGGLFMAGGLLQQLAPGQNNTITIVHDYTGVKEFIESNKPWKPTKPGTLYYVQSVATFKEAYPNISIKFKKVKAHSGVKWNEVVDAIANGIDPLECKGKMMAEYVQEK